MSERYRELKRQAADAAVAENNSARRRWKRIEARKKVFESLPEKVRLTLQCPNCGELKSWTGEHWACAKSLSHGWLCTKEILLRAIEAALGLDVPVRHFHQQAIDILANHAKIVGAHWSSARPGFKSSRSKGKAKT